MVKEQMYPQWRNLLARDWRDASLPQQAPHRVEPPKHESDDDERERCEGNSEWGQFQWRRRRHAAHSIQFFLRENFPLSHMHKVGMEAW
jgi:hypothetical protein